MTKAMTGLVIADAVSRGEIRMDAPVATYLPQLGGSPAGAVTINELVTHTSGYVEFGAVTLRRAVWAAPVGRNFLTADSTQMIEEARDQTLGSGGRYAYSSLGVGHRRSSRRRGSPPELPGADAHPAVRAARHVPTPPSRSTTPSSPAAGRRSGLPGPAVGHGCLRPTGGAVSTTGDLAKLATALLDGTAPGLTALDPTTATDQSNTRIGTFWHTSIWQTGQTITHHAGQTGGYASYLGLDRQARQGRHRPVRRRQRRRRPRQPAARRPQRKGTS